MKKCFGAVSRASPGRRYERLYRKGELALIRNTECPSTVLTCRSDEQKREEIQLCLAFSSCVHALKQARDIKPYARRNLFDTMLGVGKGRSCQDQKTASLSFAALTWARKQRLSRVRRYL